MSEAKITLSAVDNTRAAFASLQASLASNAQRVEKFNGAVQGLLAVGAIAGVVATVRDAVNEFDRLGDTAPKIGLTTQELAELGFAAKLSGTDAATLEGALGKLNIKIADAAGGSKDAQSLFASLGVSIKNARGEIKGTAEIFGELAGKFSKFDDGPLKSALAVDVFSKSGKELIPLLNQGAEGIAALRAEFASLAGGDISEAAAISGQFNDNLDRLRTSALGFGRTIIEAAGPALNEIIGGFVSASQEGDKFSLVGEALRVVLETVAIGGANVAFVFQTIGANIGGLVALVAAEGDLKDSIFESIKADNEARRTALDNYEKRILGARQLAKEANAAAAAEQKSGRTGPAPVVTKPDQGSQKEFDAILASIAKRGTLLREELALGRSLTESERFRLDVLEKLAAGSSKLTSIQKDQLRQKLDALRSDELARESQKRRIKEAQDGYAQELEFEQDLAAARKQSDDAFESRTRAAIDASISAGEAAQLAEVEAKFVLATDAARGFALEKLRIELGLQRQIAAINADLLLNQQQRAELIGRASETAARDIATVQQRITVDEFRATSQDISAGLTEAIIQGFENGKDGARSLVDFVKAQFKNLVLKPIISAVVNPIAGGIAGALGFAGSASAGQVAGNVGGLGNLVSGFKSAYDIFSGGLSSASELFRFAGQDIAGGVSSLIGASESTALALDGLGASIGSAVPYVAAALAAYQIADRLFGGGGGPKTESGAGLVYGDRGLPGEVAQQISDTIKTAYVGLSDNLRLAVQDLRLGIFTSVDTLGDALTQFDVVGTINGQAIASRGSVRGGVENVGRTPEDLQRAISEETARVLLLGLKASNLPEQFRSLLAGVSESAGLEELQAAIGRVSALRQQQLALEDRYFELTATDAERLARVRDAERAAVDPLNRALLEQVFAAEDAANGITEVGQALRSVADIAAERAQLQAQIDQLSGNTAAIRERERAAIDASNLALFDQVQALQDQKAAAELATRAAQDLAAEQQRIGQERAGLQNQLDQLLGNTAAIRERERAAINESNLALFDQVRALQEQKTAAELATQAAQDLAAEQQRIGQERAGLQNTLDQLLGNTAAIRERERAAISESNLALFDQVQALQAQKAAAEQAAQSASALAAEQARLAQEEVARLQRVSQERAGLQNQLDQLLGNTAAIRARERAAIDASNLALFDQVQALQEQKTAAEQAAQAQATSAAAQERAAQEESERLDRIAAQRAGLLDQLAEALAITPTQARARERAALDESNRAIFDYVQALQDQKAAVEGARSAVSQASDRLQAAYDREAGAFQQRIEQIKQLGGAIGEFVASLDGQLRDAAGVTLQSARAEFAQLVARAKAGDQEAAGRVVASGQQLAGLALDASPDRAAYIRELARIRGDAVAVQATLDGQKAEAQSQLDQLGQTVAGLVGVSESLQTVGDALTDLQTARQAQALAEAQQAILVAQASSLLGINGAVLQVRDVLAGRLSADSVARVAGGAPVSSLLPKPVGADAPALVLPVPSAVPPGGDAVLALVREVQALRAQVAALQEANSAENVAAVQASQRVASILDRVSDGATALRTVAVTA